VKFKIDENLPVEVRELFRTAGHDALTVVDQQLGGCSDSDLAAVCNSEDRALVTADTDFANILAYPPGESGGFVVLRTNNQSKHATLAFIPRILAALALEPIGHRLWIVESDRIRVRGPEARQ
jgi:predicted nuclease of predicted toxin-antitoxin system